MRFPVKLNRAAWPEYLTRLIPSAVDPRVLCAGKVSETVFASTVPTFKFGAAFKSTHKSRFPLILLELAQLEFQTPPVILEVGASDGSASLDLLLALPFEKYYVTDLNLEIYYEVGAGATWFYDAGGNCLLCVTDRWIIYPDHGSALFPFNFLAPWIFKQAPKFSSDIAKIRLINPALLARKDDRIVIEKYNLLDAWPYEKADLIVAANLINPSYFTSSEIKRVLTNLLAALNGSGRIALIENRPTEKATLFKITAGSASIEKRINGGVEIESLALNSLGGNPLTTPLKKVSEQV